MNKREFKRKQKRLLTLSKVAMYCGLALSVLVICVSFTLGSTGALLGTLAGGLALGALSITAGVMIESSAQRMVYTDESQKEYEVKEYHSEKEHKQIQTNEQQLTDEKQVKKEEDLTL